MPNKIVPINSIHSSGWKISNTKWAYSHEDMTLYYSTVNYSLLPRDCNHDDRDWHYEGDFSAGEFYVGCGGYTATFKTKEDAEELLRMHPEWDKEHFEIFYMDGLS